MRLAKLAVLTGTLTGGLLVLGMLAPPSASPFSTPARPAATTYSGISCASTTTCVAVGVTLNGAAAQATTVDGSNWQAGTLSIKATLNAVSCPSTSVCVAVGSASGAGTVLTTTNDTATWTIPPLPAGTTQLDAVDCPSTSDCYAVGASSGTGTIIATINGGGTWVDQSVPAPYNGFVFNSISCSTTAVCMATYTGPNATGALQTANSGTTWTAVPLPSISGEPPGDTAFLGVSCPSTTNCFVSGEAINTQLDAPFSLMLATTDGGSTWAAQAIGGNGLSGTACVSTGTCESVSPLGGTANSVWGTTNAGTSWNAQTAPAVNPSIISCPSATTCFATGANVIMATSNGGATWSAQYTATPTHGYWLVGTDGGVFSFGSAGYHGSTGNIVLNQPIVGITPTSDFGGYWLTAADGGVFAFGDATYYGSVPGIGISPAGSAALKHLNAPIVGAVPSIDNHGYFLVGADGGVFAFGDAQFEGSCPQVTICSGQAVAVMPDATGNGYWLVTKTGKVYDFGDAPSYGAPAPQSYPVTSAVRTPDGRGYWILFGNGAVAGFGDAANLGGPVGQPALNPALAMFATSDAGGYGVATANGNVSFFGDEPNDGTMVGKPLNGHIIAAAGF